MKKTQHGMISTITERDDSQLNEDLSFLIIFSNARKIQPGRKDLNDIPILTRTSLILLKVSRYFNRKMWRLDNLRPRKLNFNSLPL